MSGGTEFSRRNGANVLHSNGGDSDNGGDLSNGHGGPRLVKHGADHNASIHEGGDDEDDHLAGASHLFSAPTFSDSRGNRACQFEKRRGLSSRSIQSYELTLPSHPSTRPRGSSCSTPANPYCIGETRIQTDGAGFHLPQPLPQLGARTAASGSRRGVGWQMSNGCRPKAASSTQIRF